MISSQIYHYVSDFDEIIQEDDPDFMESGLKTASVIRIGRLAVVDGNMLLGATGKIASDRLRHIKTRLADWLVK